jgi:hypothetical protein
MHLCQPKVHVRSADQRTLTARPGDQGAMP